MSLKIPKNPFKFGLFASRPYIKWTLGALVFVFFATAAERFLVVILRNLTDSLASSGQIDFNSVWFWASAYPITYFLGRALWRGSGFTGMRWFTGMRSHGYQVLYEYLSLHSKDYFNSKFAGALANKISNAVEGARGIFERMLWQFIPLIVGLVWYTIFASMQNIWLGVIILVWAVIFLGINFWLSKRMRAYSYKFAQSMSTLKGKLVDSLSNISLVHENAFLGGERQYIKTYIDKQTNASLTQWWFSEWVLVTNGVMIFIFMFMMIGASVYLFQNQMVSIGAVIMVVAIVVDLSQQLFFIGNEIKEVSRNYGEAGEGLEEILSEHIIVDSPGALDVNFTKGEIVIDSINFNYENSKVFKNFSLTILPGQKVGFVGRSGAGKTTFVSLLLRHFEVSSGDIRIDGKSISKITLESLRRAIAFVPQDTSLFHRTIRENIGYSKPEATLKQVKESARLAQADGFIQKLPQGYETLVGERGVKLSGGQRQRIAIARAFIKDAPILILDEATSSLDSHSEHAIQMSLDRLMKDRTVIAIAHRLSTLKKMDRIVFIEDGRIIEDGAPEELLKKPDGLFKKMWDHQVKGFIVDP